MANQNLDITLLLQQLSDGNRDVEATIVPHIYDDLRRIASRYLRGERQNHTLQTTALVHESYLRLVNQHQVRWRNRNHFFAVASQIMQRILVDHARSRLAEKRGGDSRVFQLDAATIGGESDELHLALNEALDRLKALDPRQCRVVVMRFYGGMTEDEIADTLGVSSRTVKRDWESARIWLYSELTR